MPNERTRNPNYRRPPKQYQFRKGQSGNPRGRPRGSQGFHTILAQELRKTAPIRENGKRVRRTNQEVIAQVLIVKALKGDPRAIKLLLEWSSKDLTLDAPSRPTVQFIIDGLDVTGGPP